MIKTGNKWFTEKCGRCGESHNNYSGKLDKDDIEYVVCGCTNKRMNVMDIGNIRYSILYDTLWIKV